MIVLPKAIRPLVYNVRFIDKHTENACLGLLVGVDLLHAWVTKEVFGRGEYQVHAFVRVNVPLQSVLVKGCSLCLFHSSDLRSPAVVNG